MVDKILANYIEYFSLQNILNILIFLVLVFLGVAGRVSIDIELEKNKLKDIRFFNRFFIAAVLSYILDLYLSENDFFRKYYSGIIILFCIFVNDLIKFVIGNKNKILVYILNAVTKGVIDLKNTVTKGKNNDNSNSE
jgi:succinate dehydrogenase hydrophobic anchor subunit